jgi:hypothetical protein
LLRWFEFRISVVNDGSEFGSCQWDKGKWKTEKKTKKLGEGESMAEGSQLLR